MNNIINKKYKDLTNFREGFFNSKPFPYICLDNFLDESFFNSIKLDEFDNNSGKKYNTEVEKNKWISKNSKLPDKLKTIIDFLNSDEWINNLNELTKMKELFTTKVANTHLANYHVMNKNGFLGSHVDHSSDPSTGYPHVLNIILYLTKNWKKEWGGGTTLMDKTGKKIINKIEYVPNRAVVFLHTPYSFHGVENINSNIFSRSSIYVDYYAKNFKPYDHFNLDFKKKWFKHSTCFVLPRKIQYFFPKNIYYLKTRIKYLFDSYRN